MIEVNLDSVIPPSMRANEHLIAVIIPDLVEATRTEIIRLAQEGLTSTYDDYIQGVQEPKYHFPSGRIPESGGVVASIALVGMVPNMIESGWEGGDMKPALLAGRNAKQGKEGPYNVVPFRHGTPGTTGRAASPMGSQYGGGTETHFVAGRVGKLTEKAARNLGRGIHRAAKALEATTTHPDGGTRWGARLPAGMAPLMRAHHKTDIYAGMVRQEKTYAKATQSQYTTFRAVSQKSDPASWIHPGLEPRDFFKQAAGQIDKIVPRLLKSASKGMAES